MANDLVEVVAAAISLARDDYMETIPMPVTDYDRDLARACLPIVLAAAAKVAKDQGRCWGGSDNPARQAADYIAAAILELGR